MTQNQSWSLNFGRWGSVSVRIHYFLLLSVAAIFGAEWNIGATNVNFFSGTAMVTALAFLVAIAIHQIAHVFATRSIGGQVDEIVLMPWGGNCQSDLPRDSFLPLAAHVAGPFVNGMLFLLGASILLKTGRADIVGLMNPFHPHPLSAGDIQSSIVTIFTWVNFQLMIVNLIPCFPFDGARMIRTVIEGFQVEMPKYRIETAIMLIGHAAAFALIGMALVFVVGQYEPGGFLRPAWMFMLIVGLTLFFSARYSLEVETEVEDDHWSELDALEYNSFYETTSFRDFTDESDNVAYSQWLSEKQEARRLEEQERETEEDTLADQVLEKLHDHGGDLGCLSETERRVLNRFSERVRRRRQQRV
jgi:Zn-dependent protease